MAKTVKCKTCGNLVSKKAEKCPSCGEPQKKSGNLLIPLLAGIILIFVIYTLSGDEVVDRPEETIENRYAIANLNIRDDAGTNHKVLETLEAGEILYVTAEEDGWIEVSPKLKKDYESGWVSKEYTEIYEEEAYDQWMTEFRQQRAEAKKRTEEIQRQLREEREQERSQLFSAYYMSRTFVERQLVAPATAEFPSYHDDAVQVQKRRDGKFEVKAYVDSQNRMGALIRSHYVAVVYPTGNDNWRLDELELLE